MVKLKALGVATDTSIVGVEPRVQTTEPAFARLYEATRDRAPVRFAYRTGGRGEPAQRTVEPWRITSWHGRWYLVGHDRDRDAPRVFRLSRIEGQPTVVGPAGSVQPPPDVDARAMVENADPRSASRTATVRVAEGAGLGLRRRTGAGTDLTVLEIPFVDVDDLAEEVAALGPAAVVEGPDDLRDAVVARLRGTAAAHARTGRDAVNQPARRAASQQSATDRLSRLLSMVPYLVERQGVPVQEAAQHFGLTEDELVADLQLLFLCGLPGGLPGDLIEAEWEGGEVFVSNADTIARPLRLALDEAVALLVGLRTLAETPGRATARPSTARWRSSRPPPATPARRPGVVSVALDDDLDPALLARVRDAVDRHRRLHLRYHVPGRDEATERDVDPMRLLSLEGHIYLEGWCHRADAVRLFRLGRVLDAQVLDVDGTPPPQAVSRDLDDSLFQPSPSDLLVTLDLAPGYRWVVDSYPYEDVEDLPDGGARLRLRVSDTGWVRQLVLRSGGGVVVAEPAELAAEVAGTASAALAAYADPA